MGLPMDPVTGGVMKMATLIQENGESWKTVPEEQYKGKVERYFHDSPITGNPDGNGMLQIRDPIDMSTGEILSGKTIYITRNCCDARNPHFANEKKTE